MKDKHSSLRDRLRSGGGTPIKAEGGAMDDGSTLWSAQGRNPKTPGKPGMKVRLTQDLLFFEKGLLHTDSQQIPLAYVFDVDVDQGLTQKMAGVADMKVHVRRPEGSETAVLEDMPDFRNGAQLINDAAKKARYAEAQGTNVHYFATVPSSAPIPQPPAAPAAAEDPMAQLQRLKDLRDAGLLTDDEYAAKKAQIIERL